MKKNIFITILAILVLGLGGYLVYDKVIDKDVKEEVKEESIKQEGKNYDLAEAKKLVDKYYLNAPVWQTMFEGRMTEQEKILIAINNTKPSNANYNCGEAFPNGQKEEDYVLIENENLGGFCKNDSSVYTYGSVNTTYHELFGEEKDLPKEAIVGAFNKVYAYSEKYDSYLDLFVQGGFVYLPLSYYEVVNAVEVNNSLEVTINNLFLKYDEHIEKYYVSQDYDINIDEENWANGVSKDQLKDLYNRAMAEIGDKIPKYKFTFKKSDTGYYLESIVSEVY